METLERLVVEQPFFKDLNPSHVQPIIECANNAAFDAGEFIFREGEEAHRFYLIRQGKIALEIFNLERGPIVVQTLGEGDALGWAWLFPPYRWHFDARALAPTRAIVFDGNCLRGKCEQDQTLGYDLLKRVAHIIEQRLHATRLQLLEKHGFDYKTSQP